VNARAIACAIVLASCGGREATPAPRASEAPTITVAHAPPTSIVGLDDPPPVPDDVVAAGPLRMGDAPAHGCVLSSDAAQPVLEGASAADVALVDRVFVVAAYVSGSPDVVALARIAPGGAPSPLGRIEIGSTQSADRRAAPPIVERLGEASVGVALVDGSGGVRLVRFEAGTPAPSFTPVQLTPSGADVRYPPALTQIDAGTLVAWTEPSGTTAHVHVALVHADGAIAATHDVTPDAGAAAAPVFDAHAVLYTMDARAGISVVHRTPFGADGAPGSTSVAEPINLAAEPPAFAIVGDRLAYAAVGNVATRAVGLVTLGSADRPQPLVAGLGYGAPLTLDAVALGHAVLFATEAPSAADASAPHETRLRVVLGDAIGDATVISGMTAPRVAIGNGAVAIVGRGAAVRWARCAE
jgi:hypothetical protein